MDRLRRMAMLGVSLLLIGVGGKALGAADADALAAEINTELRNAERQMHSGKNEEALQALDAIAVKLEALKAADAGHRQLAAIESKYGRTRQNVERRAGPAGTPATGPARAAPAAAAPAGDKLPSGVSFRLKKINDALAGRRMREDPFDLMMEIETQYGGQYPADHPEILTVKQQLAELKAKREAETEAEAADAAKAEADRARREAASAVWVKKLSLYTERYDVAGNRPNPKYLAFTTTQDVEELNRLQKNYEEASALFAEYKKTAFPHGKTPELEGLEETLAQNIEDFAKSRGENLARLAGRPMEQMDELISGLKRDTAWQTDPKQKPRFLRRDDLAAVEALVTSSEKAIGEDQAAALRAKYAELVRMDQERRTIAAERTFMLDEKFKGGEHKDLKAKAVEIVRAARPDAEVLRTAIISEDWKEEDVQEWTDTTQTALRRRITRSLSGQVAARRPEGVFLYTVHLAKDKRSDGAWGPLKGHIMFTDAMAEANVKK